MPKEALTSLALTIPLSQLRTWLTHRIELTSQI